MNKFVEYTGKAAGIASLYAASNYAVDYIGEKANADWLYKELFEVGNFDIEVDDLMALPLLAFLWIAIKR